MPRAAQPASVDPTLSVAQTVSAKASFAALGNCLGCTGIELYVNGATTEIFASTTGVNLPEPVPGYVPGDFWYSLVYDTRTQNFKQNFVSDRLPGGVAEIHLMHASQAADDELAVCGQDGSIRYYDARTKQLKAGATQKFPMQNVVHCRIGDFAHSGRLQYLLASNSQVTIFNAAGTELWSLPPPGDSYIDVAVGQMDEDSALEIAVSQYTSSWAPGDAVTVYDGATHLAQLHLVGGVDIAAGDRMTVGDVDGAGIESLVVSEGWGAVDLFDVRTGTRRWQVPTPQNIESLAVANVSSVSPQVLVGDGQWGAIRVFDGQTGTASLTIPVPTWGVTNMAVGRIAADGSLGIMFGGDAGDSGQQRFGLAQVKTQSVVATSHDLDGLFTAPSIGHLAGDRSTQVAFASKTSDGAYDPGSVVVMNTSDGSVRAEVFAPSNQGWGNDDALRVGDVDGDGVDEVVVAGTQIYSGVITTYKLTRANDLVQVASILGDLSPSSSFPEFTALALAPGDAHGKRLGVVGFVESNPSRGPLVPTVAAFDLESGTEQWSVAVPSGTIHGYLPPSQIEFLGKSADAADFYLVRSTSVGGGPASSSGNIHVIRVAGSKASIVASYDGVVSTASSQSFDHGNVRFLVGTFDGSIKSLELRGTHQLVIVADETVSTGPIDAVYAGVRGSVWYATNGRLMNRMPGASANWQSTDDGYAGVVGIAVDEFPRGARRRTTCLDILGDADRCVQVASERRLM
jgi:WD40 repeat protein